MLLTEEVVELFRDSFEVLESKYVQRETVNYKEDIHAQRIFVQGRFQKRVPDTCDQCDMTKQAQPL